MPQILQQPLGKGGKHRAPGTKSGAIQNRRQRVATMRESELENDNEENQDCQMHSVPHGAGNGANPKASVKNLGTPTTTSQGDADHDLSSTTFSVAAASPLATQKAAYVLNGLAIDTRCLGTAAGITSAKTVLAELQTWMQTLSHRQVLPCAAAVPIQKTGGSGTDKPTLSISIISADDVALSIANSDVEPLLSYAAIPCDATVNTAMTSVPKGLMAKASWKLLSTLVSELVAEHCSSPDKNSPVTLTLITTDGAFFLDTDMKRHAQGLGDFLSKIESFQSNDQSVASVVSSVRIVCIRAASVALMSPASKSETEIQIDESILSIHQSKMMECLDAIRAVLSERASASAVSHDDDEVGSSPPGVSFETINCHATDFKSLSRQWVRDAMPIPGVRTLRFDLPETLDGTQCTLAMEMAYSIMPFGTTSRECEQLVIDIERLSNSAVQIVQLVPLDAVDASLVYGVPITVVASLEGGFEEHQTMRVLVETLFQKLQEQENGLLLRSELKCSGAGGLFVPINRTVDWLLTPFTMSDESSSSGCGILHRYASADCVLSDSPNKAAETSLETTLTTELVDYVDRALDCVPLQAINPLFPLVGAKRYSTENAMNNKAIEVPKKNIASDYLNAESSDRIGSASDMEFD